MDGQRDCGSGCCIFAFLAVLIGMGYYILTHTDFVLVQQGHTVQEDMERARQLNQRRGPGRVSNPGSFVGPP
jgi:hypothetical protein